MKQISMLMKEREFFHGGNVPFDSIDPERLGADGELLCASASVNVAMRYGNVITGIRIADIDQERIYTVTVNDWFSGRVETISDLRLRGVGLVLLTGYPEAYDFPVSTLFVVDASAVVIDAVLETTEISELDDGLPLRHEPLSPADRGWLCYVKDFYQGDEVAALADFSTS